MLKSLHSVIRERLAKGGPGSGRHPDGGSEGARGSEKVTTPDLSSVDTTKLSPIERREFARLSQDHSKEGALQVIINTVEGDWSQLSEQLKSRAEKDKTFKMAKGGPGSGRHPEGQKSIYAKPHEAIGVKKEDLHPSVRWAGLAQVFPTIYHTTDDLTDKGKRFWIYTLSGKNGKGFFQSHRYADRERAINAMKNHLLTGKKNPIHWYKP